MEFYAIRFVHSDGGWSHPWTIFASDIHNALSRFMVETGATEIAEIIIRKRSLSEAASFYGRSDVGGGAKEHPSIKWDRE